MLVPGASFAKLNVNVSHAPATVVNASVSHVCVGSVASSTFIRIGVPEVGDQTRTVISESVRVKGIIRCKTCWSRNRCSQPTIVQ